MANKRVTQAAFRHALQLIRESYPDMAEELQMRQAVRLAEKICKKSK